MNAYRDQYAQLFKNGRNVVLIAISADPDTALYTWARDAEFPFLFASDTGTVIGKMYGALASRAGLTNRNLFGGTGRKDRLSRDAVPGDRSDGVHGVEYGDWEAGPC